MDYEKFVNQQNALTIDEEVASCYQLVSNASDEVWTTLPWPSSVEVVGDAIRELADSFTLGPHAIRLQVLTRTKVVRAQILLKIEGRQSATKNARGAEEHILHAKALRANVEVSEQQLSSMLARNQAQEVRNEELQARLIENTSQSFEMMVMLQDIVSRREDQQMRQAEHDARMAQIASFTEKVTPVLLPLVGMAAQYFGAKFEAFIAKETAPKAPTVEPESERPAQPN